MSSALSALEQLLALSEAMLKAASAQDWEALASREGERRALVDKLPATLGSEPATAAQARALIDACLQCDAQVRPLVATRLNELRVLLRETPPGV